MAEGLARGDVALEEAVRIAARVTEVDTDVADMARWHTARYSQDPFLLLRLRELGGTVTVPHDDDYVLSMVSSLDGLPGSRRFLLTYDHDLREAVFWRIFEVEGGGEVSLANVDAWTYETWQQEISSLLAEGLLSRSRLLRSALDALARDFGAYTSGWYSRFYRSLEPTVEELAEHEGLFLGLLSSRVTATVSFAVSCLKRLHAAGRGDLASLVAHARPGVLSTKANALALLTFARAAMHKGADIASEDAAAIAVAALEHAHPDVRRRAEQLLEEAGRRDLLPAAPSMGEIQFLGAEEAPARRADTAVRPWPRDDVVEHLAAALAGHADAIECELALAELARIEDRSLLAPLAKTARHYAWEPTSDRRGAVSRSVLALLVLDALGERYARRLWGGSGREPFIARAREVSRVLRRGAPRVLLATPDERTGWVHPHTLVDRLLHLDSAELPVLRADHVSALLRLSHQDRPGALERLPDAPALAANEAAFDAARYALGGPRRPIDPIDWWIAAARAHDPLGDDALLIDAGHDHPGAGRPIEAVERWRIARPTSNDGFRPYPYLRVHAGPPAWSALRPTCIPSGGDRYGRWQLSTVLFGETLFPHDADSAAVVALPTLLHGLQYATEVDQIDVLTGLANHPGRWGALSSSALVLGLAQKPRETRLHAAELFATVVPDRASVEGVAAAFVRHAPGCVATRWAASLADAAAISVSAERAVADTLAATLPQLSRTHHGIDKLLDLLAELAGRHSRPITAPSLRAWLEGYSGASRAARAAAALLARTSG